MREISCGFVLAKVWVNCLSVCLELDRESSDSTKSSELK